MRMIHKFQFGPYAEPFHRVLPVNSTFIRVAYQETHGEGVAWYVFDVSKRYDTIKRTFVVRPTGDVIEDGLEYVGTYSTRGDYQVWHLFEVTGPFTCREEYLD